MKHIYTLLLGCSLLYLPMNGQTTLTKASNEPAAGDMDGVKNYDSTTVLPKSTGTGQTWNFSSLTQGTITSQTTTYVATTGIASASLFPGATLAQNEGGGSYSFFKSSSSPSQFEFLGLYDPTATLSFTANPQTIAVWPVALNGTFSDTYSGNLTSSFGNGTITGSSTVTATGSGVLILPGGASFSNVLQLRTASNETSTITFMSMPFTSIDRNIQYSYFHTSQKFPLLTVSYGFSDDGSGNVDTSGFISVNYLVAVGINDYNLDATFSIYPNPAKDGFNVKLSNPNNEHCIVTIYSATGQQVKQHDLMGSSEIKETISISELSAGIYFVNTQLGEKISTRKLIVE